jgi:PTS system mannose-specific IIA component
MIGVVIFGHGRIAHEFARVADLILGTQERLFPIGVDPDEGEAVIEKRLGEAIKAADEGEGVLLLTDMFGGTPMNFGCRYLEAAGVEVVTGVNLALLIRALTARKQSVSLPALAKEVAGHGRGDISVASELLRSGGAKG